LETFSRSTFERSILGDLDGRDIDLRHLELTPEIVEVLPDFLHLLASLAKRLGDVITRHFGESQLRESEILANVPQVQLRHRPPPLGWASRIRP
jgi:hypothetical protein